MAGGRAVALAVPVYDFMADSETTVSKARPVCCNRDQFGNHCLDVRSIFEAAHGQLVRDSNDHSRVRLFGRSVPAKCAVRFASDLGCPGFLAASSSSSAPAILLLSGRSGL